MTRLWVTVFFMSVALAGAWAQDIEIANRGLIVRINVGDGTIRSLVNRHTGESYQVKALPVRIDTNIGRIEPKEVIQSRRLDSGIEFVYRPDRVAVTVRYRLEPGQDFLRKTVDIKNVGKATLIIHDVFPEVMAVSPNFEEIHPHRDPSQYAWLINIFLRSAKGGFYCGIENPFYDELNEGTGNVMNQRSWLRLGYRANWLLPPDTAYETDASFLGAYRNQRVYAFKELGKLKQALRDPAGVPWGQINGKGVQTALSFDQEILDWGEIWAMQDFLRVILPPHDSKRPGFYVRVLANVGGRPTSAMTADSGWEVPFGPQHVTGSQQFIDDVVALGHIPHVEWADEWFGVGGYALPTPGLILESMEPGQPTPVNAYWKDVVEYGKSKGIAAGIFETVTRDFARGKSDWKVLMADGTPWVKSPGPPPQHMNCWANREYVDWRLAVTDQAVRDYDLYMTAWDSHYPACWAWLGWPDNKTECWATNHSHLPGDIRYQIFRNILWFLRQLQARHPHLAMRVAAGTVMDYPWVLKDLIEYHPAIFDFETGGSYWVNENYRFIPMYKSGVVLAATSDLAFKYLLLRSISASDHILMFSDAVSVALRNKRFWDKWLSWADENIRYLRVGRTLFRDAWGDRFIGSLPPALEGPLPANQAELHGSAHCIDDRGFLFLLNPSKAVRIGAVTLDHRLGLARGERFQVKELAPTEGRKRGVYGRGEELRVAVPAETVMVLEIRPTTGSIRHANASATHGIAVDRAFLTWEEIPWKEIMPR